MNYRLRKTILLESTRTPAKLLKSLEDHLEPEDNFRWVPFGESTALASEYEGYVIDHWFSYRKVVAGRGIVGAIYAEGVIEPDGQGSRIQVTTSMKTAVAVCIWAMTLLTGIAWFANWVEATKDWIRVGFTWNENTSMILVIPGFWVLIYGLYQYMKTNLIDFLKKLL